MLTRCPQCETTFRVTPEQLKARQGRVRCGECQEVFNALDTLIDAAPLAPLQPPTQPIAEEVPEDSGGAAPPPAGFDEVVTEDGAATPATEETVPDAVAEALAEPAFEPASPPEPDATFAPDASFAPDDAPESVAPAEPAASFEPTASFDPAVSFAPLAASEPAVPLEPPGDTPEPAATAADLEPPPELEPLLHEAPRRRAWPWALGTLTALLVLAAQTALHFRTEIAVLHPDAKPLLAAACKTLGCELLLPRKPDLVGIETSDLHPGSGGKLALTATLKNRAPFAQEYPHLELTLTDTVDQALIRRILAPGDYLAPKTVIAAGFGANADLAVNLVVEAPGVPAVGYRLYLFYP